MITPGERERINVLMSSILSPFVVVVVTLYFRICEVKVLSVFDHDGTCAPVSTDFIQSGLSR
jgi:hypothetical protein